MTRASFILRGALAAGAVYGTSAVTPFVSSALAQTGTSDVDILNFALTLEYLEADFYNAKAMQVGLSGQAKEYAKQFGEEEQAHVAALEAAIKELRGQADAVSKYSVTLEANANKEGHLYGSIVANDISKALKSAGYQVDADHINLDGPLKELGMYTVKVELHADVKTEVKVWVVPAASN